MDGSRSSGSPGCDARASTPPRGAAPVPRAFSPEGMGGEGPSCVSAAPNELLVGERFSARASLRGSASATTLQQWPRLPSWCPPSAASEVSVPKSVTTSSARSASPRAGFAGKQGHPLGRGPQGGVRGSQGPRQRSQRHLSSGSSSSSSAFVSIPKDRTPSPRSSLASRRKGGSSCSSTAGSPSSRLHHSHSQRGFDGGLHTSQPPPPCQRELLASLYRPSSPIPSPKHKHHSKPAAAPKPKSTDPECLDVHWRLFHSVPRELYRQGGRPHGQPSAVPPSSGSSVCSSASTCSLSSASELGVCCSSPAKPAFGRYLNTLPDEAFPMPMGGAERKALPVWMRHNNSYTPPARGPSREPHGHESDSDEVGRYGSAADGTRCPPAQAAIPPPRRPPLGDAGAAAIAAVAGAARLDNRPSHWGSASASSLYFCDEKE